MSDPVIKINLSKPTDLDFEVSVKTNCADDKPCVRLAVELEVEKRWLSLVCIKNEETKKWSVTIPPLKPLVDRSEYPFIVEVILEDYYFVPAKGMLQPMESPSVDMAPSTKPVVTATFNTDVKEEQLEERAPGTGEITGYVAPTNKLLKPEFPPKLKHVEKPEQKDTDIEDIAPLAKPGEQGLTADNRKQPDGKGEFNAREIAQQIVQSKSKAKKPTGKGYLFKRVGEQAVVDGLEPKNVKKVLDDKAEKVKKILKD
jgi:hypothetical protein